jgi:hypothetical protein
MWSKGLVRWPGVGFVECVGLDQRIDLYSELEFRHAQPLLHKLLSLLIGTKGVAQCFVHIEE